MFKQDFSGPVLLFPALVPQNGFRIRDYYPLWFLFPKDFANKIAKSWRLFRVRSPLLAESQLFSFPPGTKMFQFPGCASLTYEFS